MPRPPTADVEPILFGGRYTLLRRLAVGGMAEIYLARQAAAAGFEKLVVIKRLRAEHAADPRIIEMFQGEARIGALLNHPNIVHVYDVGAHDGVPYIAMEHIAGEELNELCRRGIAHGSFLPIEHAVELMRQAAAGMGHFHALRAGPDARPLGVVHLDISPSNLLVTQDGFLKIIDFGIASARGQRERGDVLPGKLGYMSPEQAARRPVDHRSDIFSLGVVLYEITVGRRLFRGPPREVIARLAEGRIEPPTFVRRKFPTALEAIVMRALERHPDARYQSAYDLADDLEAFMRDERMHSGPVRIARYLDALTQAAGGPRRPELASASEEHGGGAGELDFDRGVFDAYAPAAAKDWEDAEQPEADVAAALGLELAELRALRTPAPPPLPPPSRGPLPPPSRGPLPPPAPGRPAGRARGATEEGSADVTVPRPLAEPETLSRPGTATIEEDVPALSQPGPPPAGSPPAGLPFAGPPLAGSPPAAGAGDSAAGEPPALPPPPAGDPLALATPAAAPPSAALAPPPPTGDPLAPAPLRVSMAVAGRPGAPGAPGASGTPGELGRPGELGLPRGLGALPPPGPPAYAVAPPGLGQRLPWILVGVLVVALAALVAYIVL